MHTIPAAGLVLPGVERLTSIARAVVNVIGSSVATIVVAKWEGVFQRTGRTDLPPVRSIDQIVVPFPGVAHDGSYTDGFNPRFSSLMNFDATIRLCRWMRRRWWRRRDW